MLTLLQHKLLYHPTRAHESVPSEWGLVHREVAFASADGTRLHGWWFPKAGARWTVLFCHGNAGNISHRLSIAQMYAQAGLQVFMFDYRGYGLSEGTPSEQGTYEDAVAAWAWLTTEGGVAPERVVIHGKSLGGPNAAYAASQAEPAGLILDSTFSRFVDVASHHAPWLPVRWIARFEYDTVRHLGGVRAPLMVVHSPRDQVVPYRLGERCFAAGAEPKRFVRLGGGHNDNLHVSRAAYVEALGAFLASLNPE